MLARRSSTCDCGAIGSRSGLVDVEGVGGGRRAGWLAALCTDTKPSFLLQTSKSGEDFFSDVCVLLLLSVFLSVLCCLLIYGFTHTTPNRERLSLLARPVSQSLLADEFRISVALGHLV